MTLDELRALLASGDFHHATYRNGGTLWEGLHIYAKRTDGFRGYAHCGAFLRDDNTLKDAEELVRGTGVSVGAYGQG